jgi:uncharacterized damage-inducible protein DinB
MHYAYNNWANDIILDTCARLTAERFHQPAGASFDSVHHTLVHTMGGQWIWLSRWQGISPKTMLDPAEFSTLADIRDHWAAIERDTQGFVASLNDAALNQTITYRNTSGQTFSYPLWQLMAHQVNHATQHRSEIAMIVTQFNCSPGNLDLIAYLPRWQNS